MSINRVLSIIDDEPSFQLRMKLCLQRANIPTQKFITHGNTAEFRHKYAEAKAAGQPYEILFIDINLKGSDVDGLTLVKQVRENMNGFSVICVISTSNRPEEIEKARENGADAYIVKTGDLAAFTQRLTEFKENYIDKRIKEFKVFG